MRTMYFSSLVIFMLSAVAYALGFAGKSFPPFFVLHFAVFAVALPLTWLAKKRSIDFNFAPIWARFVLFALVILVLGGFWVSHREKGAVTTAGGKLARVNRGKIISEATVADKIAEEADGLKTGAGFWMVFSFAAMIFYWYGESDCD